MVFRTELSFRESHRLSESSKSKRKPRLGSADRASARAGSSSIEIDESQFAAILDLLSRLESRVASQPVYPKDEVLHLTSRCQLLETQVTILSNELEKQRVLLASKDKWTDVMEDLQASYAKQRG